MKISKETLVVLKNFSNINNSILINHGNTLATVSNASTIYARANVPELFPRTFAIYDLVEFLGGISLFRDPDFNFDNDEYLVIQEGNTKIKYYYTQPELVTSPPKKVVDLPSKDVQFLLSQNDLKNILGAANTYGLPDLYAENEGSNILLVVRDGKNKSSNSFSIKVGTTDKTFSYKISIENIKILPGNYTVTIADNFVTHFANADINLEYFIALEA